ncbi:MAG: TldD/PmbA family protein [Propionibacteriales bacterium]|nr:TldD/PmbA family protein [Propionibacteriales bacterium]
MSTPQALVDTALESSAADHCVVVLSVSSTANLRWANNTLTTNGVMTGSSVTVIAIVDGQAGMAAGVLTRAATTTAQVKGLVQQADAAARDAGPAEDAAEVIGGEQAPDWETAAGQTSTDVLSPFARDLGESLQRASREQRLLYGYVEQDVTTTYLATSAGLRLRHEQPTSHVGITGKPADLSASAWVGQATETIAEMSVPDLEAELVRRMSWAQRRVDLPAGRYDTILPPTAVADLAVYAYFVSSGRDAHEGQTVFSDPKGGTRAGQRIARQGVRLHSDPDLEGIAAAPFVVARASSSEQSVFDNGLAVGPTDWICDGTLRALGTSRYTAQLTGLPVTPLVDNLALSVDAATGSTDDLVVSADRALLLTCLWYIRAVDPQTLLLTGLTRDGVYLVEGGEVVAAVNNFRFNESPIDLLNRFSGAGQTVRSFSREWGDYFPRTMTPPLRVPDFNMSSVSQAS